MNGRRLSIPMYDVVEAATGAYITGPLEYREARREALLEEASRMQEIDRHCDTEGGFQTPEECDEAVAWTRTTLHWCQSVSIPEYLQLKGRNLAAQFGAVA